MPACRKGILLLLVFACVAGAADPALLNYIMPDAKVVAGANLSQFMTSQFGRFLLNQMQTSQPQLQQFTQATGFDPLRDLTEVLIASPGVQKDNRGLVLARGVFDPSKIGALAQKSGAVVQTYHGVQVMAGKEKAAQWFAFLDNATAVMGDAPSVQGLIDRRGGSGPNQKLRARIDQVSGTYDFWVVSTVPASDLAGPASSGQLGGIMQGDVMQGITETSGGIKFGPEIVFAGEALTHSEKDATALADVVRFFVGMAQMGVQKDPKAAASLAFLQKLDLKTQGNIMRLSLAVPEIELEKAIQQAVATGKQQAKPAATQSRPPRPQGDIMIQSSPKDMGTVVIK